jgi:hypothetical protein
MSLENKLNPKLLQDFLNSNPAQKQVEIQHLISQILEKA